MQASRQPEQPRKYHQWGFQLKWKTLPRVISDSMAKMLHIPIQVGLDNKRGWAMDDEYRSQEYLGQNVMLHLGFMRLRSATITSRTGTIEILFPRQGFPYFEALDLGLYERDSYHWSETSQSIGHEASVCTVIIYSCVDR